MTVKLLTEHHLEFLSLKGDYTGSSESTLVKMPHCWKSNVTAQMCLISNMESSTSLSVGAKLGYMGYFASLLHPPERKSWLLFSVRNMSGGLRNPCFTKFSVVNFL